MGGRFPAPPRSCVSRACSLAHYPFRPCAKDESHHRHPQQDGPNHLRDLSDPLMSRVTEPTIWLPGSDVVTDGSETLESRYMAAFRGYSDAPAAGLRATLKKRFYRPEVTLESPKRGKQQHTESGTKGTAPRINRYHFCSEVVCTMWLK